MTSSGAGIDAVHDVGLKDKRGENVGAHRLEKIVGDGLGDRNGRVRVLGLERRDGLEPRLERRVKRREVGLESMPRGSGRVCREP